ncbi:hypothetical protein [Gloeocapsopsis crepidinum]|uniref:hypothetical protein n=1 Tax=Gloeocapsopsis crepidinum TaxID=693223 RepID=UPI003899400B
MQADDLQTEIPQIIVAMITSQMFRARHPSRVTIFAEFFRRKTLRFADRFSCDDR